MQVLYGLMAVHKICPQKIEKKLTLSIFARTEPLSHCTSFLLKFGYANKKKYNDAKLCNIFFFWKTIKKLSFYLKKMSQNFDLNLTTRAY